MGDPLSNEVIFGTALQLFKLHFPNKAANLEEALKQAVKYFSEQSKSEFPAFDAVAGQRKYFSGYGCFYYASDVRCLQGDFRNHKLHGTCMQTYDTDNKLIYCIGQHKYHRIHGYAIMVDLKNKIEQIGTWYQDKLIKGIIVDYSQHSYEVRKTTNQGTHVIRYQLPAKFVRGEMEVEEKDEEIDQNDQEYEDTEGYKMETFIKLSILFLYSMIIHGLCYYFLRLFF